MSYEIIKLGVLPNDGLGDPLRVAFEKINTNFNRLSENEPRLRLDFIQTGSSVNDGSGDTLRTAFDKLNKNFGRLYAFSPTVKPIKFNLNEPWRMTFEKVNASFASLFELIPATEKPVIEIINPADSSPVEQFNTVEQVDDASYSGNINITNNFNIFVNSKLEQQSEPKLLGPAQIPLAIPNGPFGVQEWINVGAAPNDGTGDPLRTAFQKINNNFSNLFYTTTSTSDAYSVGTAANQVLLQIPISEFTQGTFQIRSNDVNSDASQDIILSAQLMQNGVGVKFSGYGTTFSNTSGICNYDMDVIAANVRILTNPIANTTIFHFIASQVTFTGTVPIIADIGLDNYPPNSVLLTEDDFNLALEQ